MRPQVPEAEATKKWRGNCQLWSLPATSVKRLSPGVGAGISDIIVGSWSLDLWPSAPPGTESIFAIRDSVFVCLWQLPFDTHSSAA